MLMIRLQRIGKKKKPSYRLVVSEKTKDPQARSLEILGIYNPVATPKVTELKEERIKHWLSQGAQPSDTVHNILKAAGMTSGQAGRSVAISKKRQAKIAEKSQVAADQKKAAEDQPEADQPPAGKTEESKEEVLEAPAEEKKEAPAAQDKPEQKAEESKEEALTEEKVEEKAAEEEKKEEPAAEGKSE